MNEDFSDLVGELLRVGARFLVVGAHAMAIHGVARATGDLDLWIGPEPVNSERVWAALVAFGAPVAALGITKEDLETSGTVVQIGLPPRRIDLLTSISGVDFEDAWQNRVMHPVARHDVPFLSRSHLIANKRESGRPKDLADLALLEAQPESP